MLHINTMENYVYGYISGMAGILVSHPFDTIKINIQENKKISMNLRVLYRGVIPPLVGVGLEKAVVFGVYHNTITYTNSSFISGALSGLTASFIVTPFERIKILLQTNQKIESKMFNRKFLFQGLSATLYRETPGFGIYFSTYHYLKKKREDRLSIHYFGNNDKSSISPFESFTYGGIAGITSWVFIYPQDRIKTHLQAIKDRQVGFIEGFKEVLKDGGYKGLYRGFHYALLRAIPLHATVFASMELCQKYISVK